MQRTFHAAAGAALACAGLLGLSPTLAVAQEKTLLVWDQFTDEGMGAAADKIYAAFTAAHPDIKIQREVIPNEQLRTVARTALAAGTGPDVVYYNTGTEFRVLATAGVLRPIDDYAAQYGWDQRFFPVARLEASEGGKLYGLGLEYEFTGVFRNDDKLAELGLSFPKSYDELVSFCKTASELGYTPVAFSLNPGNQSYHWYAALAYNLLGEEVMSKLLFDKQGRWDTPEMADAIGKFFIGLKDANCFPQDVNALTYDDANALFYSGQALLYPTGTWLIGRIQQNMSGINVGLSPFPPPAEGELAYYPTGLGSAFYISAKSAHPDEAALFLDFLYSPEAVDIWMQDAKIIPPVPSDPAGLDLPPLFEQAIATLNPSAASETSGQKIGQAFYINHAVPASFIALLRSNAQAMVGGLKTAEDVAKEFQQAWEQQ